MDISTYKLSEEGIMDKDIMEVLFQLDYELAISDIYITNMLGEIVIPMN